MLLCCRFPKHIATIAYKLSSLWSLKHTFRFQSLFRFSEILKSPNLKLLDNLRECKCSSSNSPFNLHFFFCFRQCIFCCRKWLHLVFNKNFSSHSSLCLCYLEILVHLLTIAKAVKKKLTPNSRRNHVCPFNFIQCSNFFCLMF